MLEVAPFAAIRYAARTTSGDVSALIAPPYDVLEQADKDALLAKHAKNIVAIDLPHIPPKSAGPPEAYERSNRLLNEWLADGTLVRESKPAVYIYHQKFTYAGREYIRRKFIARLRLVPFSDGVILPHEQTFGGPKEDRLALMKATKCNLSPVFGLYSDSGDEVGSLFRSVTSRPPQLHGTLDGVENLLWTVEDEATIRAVAERMASKKVYIADGHHRYGTALMYRDEVKSKHPGAWPEDHPANFVMFVLASMDDPGCLILPYHRVLLHVELDGIVEAWEPGAEPSPADRADIQLFEGKTNRTAALRFTDRAKLRALEPAQVSAWYDLDAAYLHRYLVTELLTGKLGGEPKIAYVKSDEDARRTARGEHGVALLLNATPMAHLRAVSEAGGLMPQKSTYFYPKLATGMTINQL